MQVLSSNSNFEDSLIKRRRSYIHNSALQINKYDHDQDIFLHIFIVL